MARKRKAEGQAGVRFDDSITRQRVKRGTLRRIVPYATRYRGPMALLMLATVTVAAITASSPLILKFIIDEGILPGRLDILLWLCGVMVAVTLLEGAAMYLHAWASGRIGEGVVYDLRTTVFTHVQRQSLAFFTRTQTGSLVSRFNNDVIGAREALTSLLSQATSTVLTLILVLTAMFYLSWQITLVALLIIPFFLLPTRLIASRLQRLTRERMRLEAEMGSMANERFNVAGAMLAKLYGRPEDESGLFAGKAGRVRDIDGTLELGTLVAMVALLMRLYDPIDQLSMLQTTAVTTLVSFDRVFEVLDLKPLVSARAATGEPDDLRTAGVPEIEFDRVCFRYPSADEVSLASLESIAHRRPEQADDTWT
uniref:ABC transporter ATP-binding protein n=1 Tax=Streptosporangium amethystogenes TaxID=2002 RepID=UPI00146FCA18